MINRDGVSVREAFIKMAKIVQPKTIMSDDETAFLGNDFSEYLHEKQIPLNERWCCENLAKCLAGNPDGGRLNLFWVSV